MFWIQILTLLLTGCGTLGIYFTSLCLNLFLCKMREIIVECYLIKYNMIHMYNSNFF